MVGKFLAAWAFTGVALALTFPIWITVNYLGNPDNGVILASYIGSLLMAGGYLAIGACISGHDQQSGDRVRRQRGGVLPVHDLRRAAGARLLPAPGRRWCWSTRFRRSASSPISQPIAAGVIDLRDVVFFLSLIALFLTANVVIVDLKKSG